MTGQAGKISTALASIQDRNGPNRITVTGTCSAENVNVFGFNRLTIQGGAGATINNRALTITNSRNVTLKSLTFTRQQDSPRLPS
jgi:pectate lyase